MPSEITSTPPLASASTISVPNRLLGVWAHPDDEAYLSAGLMAQTVAAGGQVTLLTLTDGEEGFPADDPRPSHERARQRRRELRAAMAHIGVTDVRFLGISDGALGMTNQEAVIGVIGDLIDEICPDVVVTFGPDGITGHPDHVANSDLVTEAWLGRAVGDLWYAAKTVEWLADWRQLHDAFDVWMTTEPTGVAGDDIEFVIDLAGADLDQKRAVLAAHSSQTVGLAEAFGEDAYRRWIKQETFRRPAVRELAAAVRAMPMALPVPS